MGLVGRHLEVMMDEGQRGKRIRKTLHTLGRCNFKKKKKKKQEKREEKELF